MNSPWDNSKLVDRILWAVFQTHDGNELWSHGKRDPDAFRRAVSQTLIQFMDVLVRELKTEAARLDWSVTDGDQPLTYVVQHRVGHLVIAEFEGTPDACIGFIRGWIENDR